MFAQRLKELRKKNNMTQVQLAERLGVSKGTVAMWETNKRTPGFDTLTDLCEIFDRRLDYILGHSNDETPFNLTDEEIDQLGRWEVEEQFKEILMAYISLDEFGRTAVENTIRTERQRCVEQQSLFPTDDIVVKLQVLAEKK